MNLFYNKKLQVPSRETTMFYFKIQPMTSINTFPNIVSWKISTTTNSKKNIKVHPQVDITHLQQLSVFC